MSMDEFAVRSKRVVRPAPASRVFPRMTRKWSGIDPQTEIICVGKHLSNPGGRQLLYRDTLERNEKGDHCLGHVSPAIS